MSAFNDAVNRACRDLPEGWTLELGTERGAAWITLTDPEGEEVTVYRDDLTVEEQWDLAVATARNREASRE